MSESSPAAFIRSRNKKQYGILIFLTLVRTIVNTLHRMVYPFLPVFARAMGVSPEIFANAIAFRSLSGLASPTLARLSDTRGRKFGMGLGMLFFISGVVSILLWPRFDVFIFGMFLAGIGKYSLDPAIQAYISDELPVSRRGEAIAIVELGWSLSYLVGGLAVGRMLLVADWDAPFRMIGVASIAALAGIFFLIPAGTQETGERARLWPRVKQIMSRQSARYGLFVGFAMSAANELVSVTFGLWLEDAFQMQLAALAAAALVIGLSELFGESLVGVITDRLGLVHAVRYGVLANCATALLLPLVARSPTGAYAGLFLFYFTFEFSLVSSISMMTALKTNSRATLMGLNIACLSFGRVIAAWTGIHLYAVGFIMVLIVVILINAASVLSLKKISLVQD